VEREVEQYANLIGAQVKAYEELRAKYLHYSEYKDVLVQAKSVLGESALFRAKSAADNDEETLERLQAEERKIEDLNFKGASLNYLAGVVETSEIQRFMRIVFRITKGNVWTYYKQIESYYDLSINPTEEKDSAVKSKTVYLIVFQGGL